MAEDRRGTDRYKLAAVRDVRALNERQQRGALAAAVGDAREVRQRLDDARSRSRAARTAYEAARATRDELVASGARGSRIALAEQFVLRRRRELEQALGEEQRREAADDARQGTVDTERARLARARAERELIDRHFERWRTSRKQLADRRED